MLQSRTPSALADHAWQHRFKRMLPKIRRLANRAFRSCSAELREELVAQVVADSYVWYRRLTELGREHDAHPTVLAAFSIKRVGCGLQVGTARNRFDITSRYCQLRSSVRVRSLDRRGESGAWRDLLVATRRADPAELAASRIDLHHWLTTLSLRDRAIALMLATGEETRRVAEHFGLTSGRISQLRRELAASWFRLHNLDANGCEVVAA